MHVAKIERRHNGRTYVSYLLRQSYREGGWSEKLGQVTEAQALEALVADGKLIKRPFILSGDSVLVGFDEAAYKKAFAS